VSLTVPESELPLELTLPAVVEAAYPSELARCFEALQKRLPVLVECDKELVPFFYRGVRDRFRRENVRCMYLDGRPPADQPPDAMQLGLVATMVNQLRDAVRGPVGQRIVVLPHLDLLTTSSGALTSEAREVIGLMYENPEILWLGFKDPSFPIPKVISNLFPHHESILGIGRDRLRYLITQRESRKFGRDFQPYGLYKYVSGLNAVRLRRILEAQGGEDYPESPEQAYQALRRATLTAALNVPTVDLWKDIGGYSGVKKRIDKEILSILRNKEQLASAEEIKRVEKLLPRGMIFWGPPGTGKTLFAKAMATALGAAVLVVSGPELKSKWVGESEENLRHVFVQARQSAPAIIVFDELDSFATARGSYSGSGVEHSMVNQLLTEMDGFRSDELVFVVGTTNFVESLDGALLRPGRFEFHLHVPYPNNKDRRAILEIYNEKMQLELSEQALDYAVKRTADYVEGTDSLYSGDHLQALCRQLARRRLRENIKGKCELQDVEAAITEYMEKPDFTSHEERVIATHEAGHAVCALHCEHSPPIERISIRGDLAGALGFVKYSDPAHRYVVTRGQLHDTICVLYGGREAEEMLLKDISIGSSQDIHRATQIAHSLVEEFGMGSSVLGVRRFAAPNKNTCDASLAETTREAIDRSVGEVLEEQRSRAREILIKHRAMVESLRDLLLEHKVLDRGSFAHLLEKSPPKS
jgi:cell division protease FtsH